MIPAAWLLSATRLAAARGDAAMSAHLSQQLGGAEREPPAWLAHEIARACRGRMTQRLGRARVAPF